MRKKAIIFYVESRKPLKFKSLGFGPFDSFLVLGIYLLSIFLVKHF